MADANGQRSSLDQAAADGSITGARHRAVEPVPIVAESADVATLDSVDDVLPAPVPGVRRRLTPRPVPGNKRKKPPVLGPVADEEPTPAEEMDDVGTHDDKAADAADAEKAVTPPDAKAEETSTGARGSTATATKAAKPKTAAEIVAAQRAREKAAEEAAAGAVDGKKDDTSVTKPLTRQPAVASTPTTGVVGNKPAAAKKPGNPVAKSASTGVAGGKGKAAMSTVGSGVKRTRNVIASAIWLIAVLAAAVLALGALFTALDQANQSNEIVRFVLDRGREIVGPFKDLFRLETAKNTLLVNWGIAALVYLIAGKIIERFVRP
ncbi:hypothetical protein [Kribbella qitaiheensis]|uniref:hypothetical protein n=1 Tax=Kribbella qitaiheensis TaxID=1544730 RepID=UPI001FE323DA|nr:hypothetical protein [Kribbella qitaiheensis]